MTPLRIESDLITLGQALKEIGIIDSGGAAKWYLAEQPVKVNDVEEARRGRKLYPGDTLLLVDGTTYVIERDS